MKKRFVRLSITSLIISSFALVTACGSAPSSSASQSPAASSTSTPAAASSPAAVDPLGKYDPPITITTVRAIDSTMKFANGEDIDNNIWSKLAQDKLGISIKNTWTVSGTQAYNQKLNVSIASGDLPDIFQVNPTQMKQLYDAGQLADLTEVYKKYASPLLKKAIDSNGPPSLGGASFNGKLMGLPTANGASGNSYFIWVRQDWLDKLHLPAPKTMDDVLKISTAFTKQDPDGNGKDDTYGLALSQTVIKQGFADVTGFFNGYHAYPGTWIKDASGNLVYGTIQPEVKTALAQLQKMYANGEIDKEFGVKDSGKEAELVTSSKIGMTYGALWNPLFPLNSNLKNDPKAVWKVYPIVSVDQKPAKTQLNNPVSGYFVVSKKAKNPEALVKMMNLFVEVGWGTSTSPDDYTKLWQWFKDFEFRIFPDDNSNVDRIQNAIETKDTSHLKSDDMPTYNSMVKWLGGSGDSTDWAYNAVFGKGGPFDIIKDYEKNNQFVFSEFYGAPTPTMGANQATLDKMELEMLTKIIMGAPLDDFDKFVSDWKKLGGDQITKEVNDWYKSK